MELDLKTYRDLYWAALEGNWEKASKFFEKDPNAFTAKISVFSMTALHAAAYNGKRKFVKKMLQDKRLPSEVLAMPDGDGLTPLHYAAMAGDFKMAEALLTADSSLTQIADCSGFTPLLTACALAPECKELVWYLARKTKDDPPASPFTGKMAGQLISCLAYAGFYDIVHHLFELYPITAVSHGNTLLKAMAEAPSNFKSGHPFKIWERLIYQIVPAESIDTVSPSPKGDVEKASPNSRSYAETPVWRRTYARDQVLRWLMSRWKWVIKSVPVIRRIQETKSRHKSAISLVDTVCKQVSNMSNEEMLEYFSGHDILVTAVINGVVEIVKVCLKYLPELICLPSKVDNQTLLFHAVKHRQEKIFSLLSEGSTLSKRQALSGMENILTEKTTSRKRQDSSHAETWLKSLSNKETHDVLIQAAKLSPQPRLTGVSGAAFQMQREIQWFKAVENMSPSFRARKFGQKPAWHTFQEEHKDLLKEGREWMKNTSNSCMLVATLIATVMFTAAFTVPGGNVEGKGIPIFLDEVSFSIFAFTDAVALFSSITSILMFLSILTSRFAEEDFLTSLPLKLIIGLFSLFLAIAAMMAAFSATLYIIVGETWEFWAPTLIVLLTSVPVALFGMLQLRLFTQMFLSTFGKSIFRPQKPW